MAMAITRSPQAIDDRLTYLLEEWEGLGQVERRWAAMDSVEREVFHLEWAGVIEPRLRELSEWAAAGELSREQLARFATLLELVRKHRGFINSVYAER
ncbi:MAG: hypothetical protein C0506_07915 [Anaerolinea sp.]|nr:hypothetical protein [Anaerolinea sp.]